MALTCVVMISEVTVAHGACNVKPSLLTVVSILSGLLVVELLID